jgi:hypothetical protein
MTAIRSTFATLRSAADRHRTERRELRQLERDLADYRTDSERLDLYAMLSRHTAEEVAPIERILTRQALPGVLAYFR